MYLLESSYYILKKLHIAVMGGHITHCAVATTQRDALVAVGRCVGHVGWAWRGAQMALYGPLERQIE
jgi:uncharacterized protein YjhX (UPF0386 family)